MRAWTIAAVSLAFALASPGIAAAQQGAAAGAATGVLTGGVIGGPVGAAVGGFVGALIGHAAEADEVRRQAMRTGRHARTHRHRRRDRAYAQRRASPMRVAAVRRPQLVSVVEHTCVRDRAGNQTCRENIRSVRERGRPRV